MVYETGKQMLSTYRGDLTTASPLAVVSAGGLCGAVSWALIYPIDSAKSIYQRNCLIQKKGEKVRQRPKIQFSNRRMYRGLGVSMSRSCIVNAIFFSAFEFLKNRINALEDI
jgi:transmembrane carrier protein